MLTLGGRVSMPTCVVLRVSTLPTASIAQNSSTCRPSFAWLAGAEKSQAFVTLGTTGGGAA